MVLGFQIRDLAKRQVTGTRRGLVLLKLRVSRAPGVETWGSVVKSGCGCTASSFARWVEGGHGWRARGVQIVVAVIEKIGYCLAMAYFIFSILLVISWCGVVSSDDQDPATGLVILADERRLVEAYLDGSRKATEARIAEIEYSLKNYSQSKQVRKRNEEEKEKLENGELSRLPYYYPAEFVGGRVGHMRLNRSEYQGQGVVKVAQVVDGSNCIVIPQVRYDSNDSEFLWFRMATDGLVDGSLMVVSEMCFEYLGTRTYETVSGGTKTIHEFRPFEILPLLDLYYEVQQDEIASRRSAAAAKQTIVNDAINVLNQEYKELLASPAGQYIEAERTLNLYEPMKHKPAGREKYEEAMSKIESLGDVDQESLDHTRNELKQIQDKIAIKRKELAEIVKNMP